MRYVAQIKRRQAHVNKVWQSYGLTEQPDRITEKERLELTRKYTEMGVFNELLTAREIQAYQFAGPLHVGKYKQPLVPRHHMISKEKPYLGVNNPIAVERLIDPETGKPYPKHEIEVS